MSSEWLQITLKVLLFQGVALFALNAPFVRKGTNLAGMLIFALGFTSRGCFTASVRNVVLHDCKLARRSLQREVVTQFNIRAVLPGDKFSMFANDPSKPSLYEVASLLRIAICIWHGC